LGPPSKLAKKEPKIVRFRGIAGNKNGEEVRDTSRCRGLGGWLERLMNLGRCLGTNGNPIFFSSIALALTKKKGVLG